MFRLGQPYQIEYAELAILNVPGDPPYETFFEIEANPKQVLCVASPPNTSRENFQAVTICPDSRYEKEADVEGQPIHNVFGLPDDVLVWRADKPLHPGISLEEARAFQADSFKVRAPGDLKPGDPGYGRPVRPGDPDFGPSRPVDPDFSQPAPIDPDFPVDPDFDRPVVEPPPATPKDDDFDDDDKDDKKAKKGKKAKDDDRW